jgi:hypothetical protein
VFAGILLKVGWDVLDTEPFVAYGRRLRARDWPVQGLAVTHLEMLLIAGTTAVTLLVDLNIAVAAFTALFYAVNKVLRPADPIPDLKPYGRIDKED